MLSGCDEAPLLYQGRSMPAARPPNPPWLELDPFQPPEGFLSFYLSDDLSALPVRGVTLAGNNKSDPNIETGTYGLFSTCAHGMRASVVRNRYGYLFFTTRKGSGRVLSGYYRLRWYAPGTLNRRPPDYALAADEVRFIHPGVALAELPKPIKDVAARAFRIYKHVDAQTTAGLLRVLRARRDRTADYVREIERLERFNLFRTGYRYVAWKQAESFGWDLAERYLRRTPPSENRLAHAASTTSATGQWQCSACNSITRNRALLKRCPECGALDTLNAVAA